MAAHRVTVLAGGVGAARFLQGLTGVMDPAAITVIGNVGDDVEVSGLHVSPDLDTVLYTLTDNIDTARGWGVRGDSTRALERARSLGADAWFQLGDLDLGLHMARTGWLAAGDPLSAVTERLATALGLAVRLLPASDDRLRTMIGIAGGEVDLQTYYVRRQHRDRVEHIRFDGAGAASPAPGVLSALHDADAIIIAPSNPLISIGPILAVTGLREALEERSAPCIAVTPIVAGAALRGPAADMLAALGHDVSAAGVAALYAGLVDAIVIDDQDAGQAAAISHEGVTPVVTDTVMRDQAAREHLARVTLDAAGLGAAA